MTRKQPALAAGYRAMTKAELRTGGFSESSRRYTRAAPGKFTARSASLSRRQAEQRTAPQLVGRTLEKLAKHRAIETRGASRLTRGLAGGKLEQPRSRYAWQLRAWAEKHGQTLGQARTDPARKAALRAIRQAKKAKQRQRTRYLDALLESGIIDDEQYDRYTEEGG